MTLLSRLESRFGRWAIPNLTTIIIAGQVLLYFTARLSLGAGAGVDLGKVRFLPGAVFEGEVWRLITFVFYPPGSTPLFVLFFWYLFFLYGTTLERTWGTARYNIYLLIAYIAHIAASCAVWAFQGDLGVIFAQNFTLGCTHGLCDATALVYGTVFLAFARYFPDFVLNIFFVLPIRIRWLALIIWIGYGYVIMRGDWMVRIVVLGALLNYLLFFGREHLRDWKYGQRRRSFQSKVKAATKQIQHQCLVCGLNSETSPKTLFRYCSKCAGQCCYCPEHIQNHEHVLSEEVG